MLQIEVEAHMGPFCGSLSINGVKGNLRQTRRDESIKCF